MQVADVLLRVDWTIRLVGTQFPTCVGTGWTGAPKSAHEGVARSQSLALSAALITPKSELTNLALEHALNSTIAAPKTPRPSAMTGKLKAVTTLDYASILAVLTTVVILCNLYTATDRLIFKLLVWETRVKAERMA